ncbi:MAG TPA: hypothetical protein VHA56_21000 [Mucilaginibacter sp.]|nr:hypothetical protein [Mucilaginibacter sp.]
MKLMYAFFIMAVIFSSCHVSVKKTIGSDDSVSSGSYTVPDDSAITKAVHDAYYAISFKEGEKPRYDSIKYYFIPEAQLINFRTDTAQVLGISQFAGFYKQFLEANKVKMFYEEELFGRTEQFGKIAHRISTYVTYLNTKDKPEERGVNSFQLIKTNDGWKVSSIIWDVEKPTLKIPDYYLGK